MAVAPRSQLFARSLVAGTCLEAGQDTDNCGGGCTGQFIQRPSHLGALLLAPDPDWVKTLPNGKLPERTDFMRYGTDLPGRVKAWSAVAASRQLAEEWQGWLDKPQVGA